MLNKRQKGELGEKDIIKLIKCPNCKKDLMSLPSNYPLYDIQCTGCSFRAQVKTNNSRPKSTIYGAGWDIMDKVTKSGFLIPPLLVNFKWKIKNKRYQEIRFYPFIPKNILKKFRLSKHHRQPDYAMFHYTSLDKLPHFVLFPPTSKR